MKQLKCRWCGKLFIPTHGNHKKFCSYQCSIRNWQSRNKDKCRIAWQQYRKRNLELCRKRTRENQIKLNNKKRFGGNRFKVLRRDNYKCQICGKDVSSKNMACIHHKNHNKSDNRIENLITYCKSCHPAYHYYNGDTKIDAAPIKQLNTSFLYKMKNY